MREVLGGNEAMVDMCRIPFEINEFLEFGACVWKGWKVTTPGEGRAAFRLEAEVCA